MALDPNVTPDLNAPGPGAPVEAPAMETPDPALRPVTPDEMSPEPPVVPDEAKVADPAAPIIDEAPQQVAGLSDWLGRIVNRTRGVEVPPSFGKAVQSEKVKRIAGFASRYLDDAVVIGNKSINLDLSKLGNDEREVDLLINGLANEFRTVINDAKRGVIMDEKLKSLAAQTGMDERKVLEIIQGSPLNAEKMLAANQVMAAVGRRVIATRDEIKLAGAIDDPEAKALMAQQLAVLLDVEARTRGAASELGRALRVMQVPVEGLPETKRIAAFMKQIDDPTGKGYHRFMKMLDQVESPEQMGMVSRFLNVAPDAAVEIWMNALLSGPMTHVANIVGNTMVAANGVLERLVAGGVGAMRRGLGGKDDGVYMGEASEMMMAGIGGFMDALRAAHKTWKTRETAFGAGSKFDLVTGKALSSETLEASGPLGWGINAIGTPMRALLAEDEFFKAFNFQMALRARAYRNARSQDLSGPALKAEMNRIMQSPDQFAEVFNEAQDYAKYVTFNRELGKFGAGMRDISNSHWAMKGVLPFVTAPANLTHYSFERFPVVNMLGKSLRNDLLGRNGNVARDLAMAKVGVGAGAAATASYLTFSGYITGRGPLNPEVKKALEAQGWQPYSFWDPTTKRYVKYDRTDPLGMFLGTVADLTQIAHHMPKSEAQELAAAVTIAFSGTLLNKTYLKGFAGLVDAAESAYRGDPEGAGVGRAMENYAGSLVPALVAQHARQIDPVVRDVRGVMDAIYARTPTWAKYAGLKTSEDVPPMRDLYGRPTLREGLTDWAVDMALPFQTKTPVDEPGLRAIVENNVAITPLSRTLVGPGEKDLVVDPRAAGMTPGVSLKPHEYDRWGELVRTTKLGGKTLKEKLDALVESDHFQRQSVGPEGGQAMLLKQQVLIYRQVAKQKLFMENDREILKRVENYYREKASKLRPSRAVEAEPGTSVDSGSAGSGAPEVSGDIANIVR